jgi:hypothetical protein
MITIENGHAYEVDNFESSDTQLIEFIQKEPLFDGSAELKTIRDGTTNEEILSMLIDRMNYLQDKFPCRENAAVIIKLDECLMWLNKRTQDRVDRGVEGKQIK